MGRQPAGRRRRGSLIVGLALQPLLTNLIAGIQIAITQPIRIDDAVIVEKEWGNVEEINATYVVVRLWDWRRMVLPLSYFIQTPFQNWTRESAALIGTAMLYVDHAAPIDRLRAKLEEIAKACAPLGRQGGQSAGHRRHRPGAGGALPGQQPQRAQDLRPALRGPREDDGLPARRGCPKPCRGNVWGWRKPRTA